MLLYSNIILLLGNAITLRRIYSILFNRVTIMILLTTGLMGCESLFVSCLDTGIGVYNGLFHSTAITHSFDLFVYIIGAIILLLTAFYPRRLIETSNNIEEISVRSAQKIGGNVKNTLFSKDYVKAYKNAIIGIDAPQFTMPPKFVTGFADGEGSFHISILKKQTGLLWKIQPVFTIGLHAKDMLLLGKIRSYFGVGEIYTKSDGSILYTVGSLSDIKKAIIPHFENYPLLSVKQVNYKLFKQVVELMDKGEHLTQKGLETVIALKSTMNLGLSSSLKEAFPNVTPAVAPEYVVPTTIDPSWLAGFVTAEGCFHISSTKSSLYKTGHSVALKFSISQHVRDAALIQKIADTLRCGIVFTSKTREIVEFRLNKLSDNLNTIIPRRAMSTMSNGNKNNELNPNSVTGFCDGEACFTVKFIKSDKYKTGWHVIPSFQIGLHNKDLTWLEQIQSFFGVGGISKQGNDAIQLRVQSLKDLKVIIDHFAKYPLITQKQGDFELFKKIVELMSKKEHLTTAGLQEIVNLRASLNNGLPDTLLAAFPNTKPVPRPLVVDQEIKDPHWLAGFVGGEGCFMIINQKNVSHKSGYQVILKLKITQHTRDAQLIKSFKKYLNCGYYQPYSDRNAGDFIVTGFSNIVAKIIPFFNKYKIPGAKALDFADFVEAAALMANKEHLTGNGLARIQTLKGGMNMGRQMSTLTTSQLGQVRENFESAIQRGINTAPVEYPLIILFILIGGILLMSSSDVVTMFLVIELQSYGLYILCTLYCDSEWSTSAGLTYFLLGGLSSCFILLGSAFLYTDCGLTNFDCLFVFNDLTTILFDVQLITAYNFYVENPEILNMGFLIMSVGYLFKISAAPFHFWSPDVYDGIPVHVTTFVAVVPKIFLIMFLSGLVFNPGSLLSLKFNWTGVLLISSFLSLIIGTVVGLVQFRFKRLLAYSAISHVGFLLLAISIKSLESFQALIFYIAQYSLSSINIFFIAIVVGYQLLLNTRYPSDMPEKQNSPLQFISQLKGFYHLNPLLAVALAISFFSLMGIPPLIGFFGKQMILSAALQGGYIFMSIIGILTSVIGAVYYLLVIKCMFFDKNEDVVDSKIHEICPSRINSAFTVTISALTLMILLFILYPSIWLSSANILALIKHSP